jgi:hypothetical protein
VAEQQGRSPKDNQAALQASSFLEVEQRLGSPWLGRQEFASLVRRFADVSGIPQDQVAALP